MSRDSEDKKRLKAAADEYVRALMSHNRRWSLEAKEDLTNNYAKSKLVATLATLGNPVDADEIEREFGIEQLDGRDSMIQLGRILIKSLTQDVSDCLNEEELSTLSCCEWRMVDIGLTNALCTDTGVDAKPVPGFLILMNQGLYFCIKLLVTAQIYEDMQGDFEQYKKSGLEVFAAACDLYVSETPEKINIGAVYTGDDEVDGAIEAHVSLGSILLMQFIALHEVGHAHMGHSQALRVGRLSALSAAGKGQPLGSQDAHFVAEYDADAFAWNALVSRAATPENNLGNIYVIRLFFRFLHIIEIKTGNPISEYHPPPQDRAARLEQLFSPGGLTEEHQSIFDRQDALMENWASALNYWEKY